MTPSESISIFHSCAYTVPCISKYKTAFSMISNVPMLICLAIARAHSVVMYVVCVFVVVSVCLIVITPLAKWTKRALDMVERTHILPNHRVHLIEQN